MFENVYIALTSALAKPNSPAGEGGALLFLRRERGFKKRFSNTLSRNVENKDTLFPSSNYVGICVRELYIGLPAGSSSCQTIRWSISSAAARLRELPMARPEFRQRLHLFPILS